jgi:hypothetical protein
MVTSVIWVVGLVVVLGVLLALAGFVLLVGLVVARFLRKSAAAAGIDLTDGIDEREWTIIRGMLARQKQAAREQAVAVDVVRAGQAALQPAAAARRAEIDTP